MTGEPPAASSFAPPAGSPTIPSSPCCVTKAWSFESDARASDTGEPEGRKWLAAAVRIAGPAVLPRGKLLCFRLFSGKLKRLT